MLHRLQKPCGKLLCIGLNLRCIGLKPKIQTDLKLYKKHKNFCSKLYKRERRKYYESLDMKNVLDRILENDETYNRIISDDFDLSEEVSAFFKDAVRSLNVKPDEYYLSGTENLSDPVETAI